MNFHAYLAKCVQNPKNVYYPDRVSISCQADLEKAVRMDHVAAQFEGGIRGLKNFRSADVSIMDCDNDSDDPKDWVHPEDLYYLFPGVAFAVVASRSDGKAKGNKSIRPRFHLYFPHREFLTPEKEEQLKRAIRERYPFFDKNALDAARFIFGCTPNYVIWHDGAMTIEEYLEKTRSPWIREMKKPLLLPGSNEEGVNHEEPPPSPFGAIEGNMAGEEVSISKDMAEENTETAVTMHPITEGRRNSTLYHLATKIVKRYGIGDGAKRKFWEQSKRCNPPLPVSELGSIWKSAEKFWEKIAIEPGYLPPETYQKAMEVPSLCPADFSDMGEAKVFMKYTQQKLVYTEATDFMVYDGKKWVESHVGAYQLCQDFLDEQKKEGERALAAREKALISLGVAKDTIISGKGLKKGCTEEVRAGYESYLEVRKYVDFVQKRRDYRCIDATMKTVASMVHVDISLFDQETFLLNTPEGTYDLREGLLGRRPHQPADYVTKMTNVSPSADNEHLWQEALSSFFLGDKVLIQYVKQQVGMALFGHVYQEGLLIAYGDGANGKSTFWNAIFRVLGSYSGSLSADVLTFSCRRNVKPEMAELKGKRLVLASELEEGMRLNTSLVKQLCSTDEILAEKKYRAPFRFTPSHTLVLCTNHLPSVGARDQGTWRRLFPIPFKAKFTCSVEKMNYADVLVEKAGGAILKWLIEGAKEASDLNFHIPLPPIVRDMRNEYYEENDWLLHFLEDCCETDKTYTQPSGSFYNAYHAYCFRQGEYARRKSDFYAALSSAGYGRYRTGTGRYIQGVRLKAEYLENAG